MNQGTRRESENVAHRFFIRNAYLFQKASKTFCRPFCQRQTFALGSA